MTTGVMLAGMPFFRMLARIALLVAVSGAVPAPPAYAAGAGPADFRAASVEPVRAIRPADGQTLARDGARLDAAARACHAPPGLPSAAKAPTAPGFETLAGGPDAAVRYIASTAPPAPRGPPPSI